jgi:hypothetical protein
MRRLEQAFGDRVFSAAGTNHERGLRHVALISQIRSKGRTLGQAPEHLGETRHETYPLSWTKSTKLCRRKGSPRSARAVNLEGPGTRVATESNPVVLHVQRPYATAEEYLEAEAWTIDSKSMLLIVSDVLPANTPVLFDVAITNGDKLIRAEGKVAGVVAPNGGKPGGLRVRFKRYGASTKAFIERATAPKPAAAAPPPEPPPAPEPVAEPEPAPAPAPQVSTPTMKAAAPAADEIPPEPPELRTKTTEIEPSIVTATANEPVSVSEPSGVHRRPPETIEAPANRDAFLARLRERAKSIDIDAVTSAPNQAARG